MSEWLDENYEVPSSEGNYLKLETGENKIRILSKPVMGWEGWKEKKATRFAMSKKPEDNSMFDKGQVKHFWGFKVWNYKENRVQVAVITQSSIQKPIHGLSKSESWGNPMHYDIIISKKGQEKQTEYSVMPEPKTELPDAMKKIITETPVDLDKLFIPDADPFDVRQPIIEQPMPDNAGSQEQEDSVNLPF